MIKYLLPFLIILVAVSGFFFIANIKLAGKQIAQISPIPAAPEETASVQVSPEETAPAGTAQPKQAIERILVQWTFDAVVDPETAVLKGSIEGNSVKDASGNNNHGFLQDALDPTSPDQAVNKISEDSISGESLIFDGKDDAVAVPYKKSLDAKKAITVSAWINLRTREGQPFKTILAKPSSTQAVPVIYSLNLDSKNKNLVFSISADKNGTLAYAISKTETPVKEWVFVAGVWDGKKIKLFVNGELVDEADTEGIIESLGVNKKQIFIGSSETTGASNFDGKIDEIQIANYAIPDEQILQAYQQYRPPGKEPPHQPYEPIGLLAKLSLDDLSGGLTDQAGNGHDSLAAGKAGVVGGKSGNALHFDNSYLTIPLSEPIKSAPEISISLWVKLDSSHRGGTLFEAKPEKEPNIPAGLSLKISSSGEPVLSKGSSPGEETILTGPTLKPEEWHHLVGEFNGKELRLYVDGILVEPSTESAKKIDWANDLPTEKTIPAHFSIAAAGTKPDGSFGNFLKAAVDDIQIYDAILSQKNVEYLYSNPGEVIG